MSPRAIPGYRANQTITQRARFDAQAEDMLDHMYDVEDDYGDQVAKIRRNPFKNVPLDDYSWDISDHIAYAGQHMARYAFILAMQDASPEMVDRVKEYLSPRKNPLPVEVMEWLRFADPDAEQEDTAVGPARIAGLKLNKIPVTDDDYRPRPIPPGTRSTVPPPAPVFVVNAVCHNCNEQFDGNTSGREDECSYHPGFLRPWNKYDDVWDQLPQDADMSPMPVVHR
ncbi:hypothetical protein BU16DRAFT_611826 [Lophium mytilinum]|uniref:Uncharacterized protein n=1 Tax=Lophium mytilinum TaxID=390894 RepID=A0A6A6RBL7_9PEZI|nr:hypothetical protein BU16DRAFT_611826 [Lophium mytilinum]